MLDSGSVGVAPNRALLALPTANLGAIVVHARQCKTIGCKQVYGESKELSSTGR